MTATPNVRSYAFYRSGGPTAEELAAARPIYVGHQQPRIPKDLDAQAQAELAREHGIDGFIYNETMLLGTKPDMPFALCWEDQTSLTEHEDRAQIQYVIDAMRDSRYIRVDNKPLFIVKHVAKMYNSVQTARIWREEAFAAGIGEIFLAYCEGAERLAITPRQVGFDGTIEIAPDNASMHPTFYETLETHDYLDMASAMLSASDPGYRRFAGVTPGFDNSPEFGMNACIYTGSQPDLYKGWVASTVQRELDRGENDVTIFVNSWNIAAEGTQLAPCSVWGNAYLQAHASGITQGLASHQQSVAESDVATTAVADAAQEDSEVLDTTRVGVSVVMVTNGDAEATMRCLQAALETCTEVGKLEFIVVDNGSTDETNTMLAKLHREVRSGRNDTALPANVAWAQARALATGEFIVFVTNDVILRPNWHTAALMALATDPTCAAVTPQIEVNGLTVNSQPLTMVTGVCLVARSAMIPNMLPSEAQVVQGSVVTMGVGTKINA